MFAGYRSQVDGPGAHVWRELAAAFPEAKVVHSVRPEEVWWRSFAPTIAKLAGRYRDLPLPPHCHAMLDAWCALAGECTFGGRMENKGIALAAFRRRSVEVRAALAPERLLVFDVAEGWGALCRFLNVPEPDTAFPHYNLRADFWEFLGGEPA
ncbi:MAG: sulfotransferase [Geminicoccaceae bacterium]